MSRPAAVVLDLGGVVLDSPLDVIAAYEAETGLPAGIVNRTVAASGPGGSWARHERGELDRRTFLEAFAAELRAAGAEVDTAELMRRVDGWIRVRPRMLEAIRRLRAAGFAVAAVTNNWEPFAGGPLPSEFDV
ncbi:MAG: HAD family hydrolase, partial [Gemmatimonadetes bacterium]|nr:HAD family hydrolase [Gemmatimonadota bacterium]